MKGNRCGPKINVCPDLGGKSNEKMLDYHTKI